jgi:Na+-driven multidrug efflux pump
MTRDFTKGPILRSLVSFTIPLIIGTLLQLTYNAADSMIVGQYVGKSALAAVGTTNPLVTLVLLFTNGICLGAGILVSTLYGAKKIDVLRRQVSTGMIAGIIFSLAAAVSMIVSARPLLALLQVESVFMEEAVSYFRLVLAGLLFSFIYNYLASMLRAMGDSVSPLIFLGVSAGLNILGDMFFVIVLDMGVKGAAVSTVLCEALSAILSLFYIQKKFRSCGSAADGLYSTEVFSGRQFPSDL